MEKNGEVQIYPQFILIYRNFRYIGDNLMKFNQNCGILTEVQTNNNIYLYNSRNFHILYFLWQKNVTLPINDRNIIYDQNITKVLLLTKQMLTVLVLDTQKYRPSQKCIPNQVDTCAKTKTFNILHVNMKIVFYCYEF